MQQRNDVTGEQEFAFQFRPGEPFCGWYSVQQIEDASKMAVTSLFDHMVVGLIDDSVEEKTP